MAHLSARILHLVGTLFCIISSSETPSYDPCVDKYPQCKMWKEQSMCLQSSYKVYMLRTCPESCGLCVQQTSDANNGREYPPPTSAEVEANQTMQPSVQNSNSNNSFPPPDALRNAESSFRFNAEAHPTSQGPVQMNSTTAVPTAPQALKLIQSLTQMIAQSTVKRVSYENNSDSKEGSKVSVKAKLVKAPTKKGGFDMMHTRKGNFFVPLLRREKVEKQQSEGGEGIDFSDKTMRLIIQSKKRSSVARSKFTAPAKSTTHKGPKKAATRGRKPEAHARQFAPEVTRATTTTTTTTTAAVVTVAVTTDSPVETERSQEQGESQTTTVTTEASSPPTTSSNAESTTQQASTAVTTTAPQTANGTESADEGCEECNANFSLVLRQNFDASLLNTQSTKYKILTGNLKQDLEYSLGPNTSIENVHYEEVPAKGTTTSLTKVHFDIVGPLTNLQTLKDDVNKGSVNGLLVKEHSLKKDGLLIM